MAFAQGVINNLKRNRPFGATRTFPERPGQRAPGREGGLARSGSARFDSLEKTNKFIENMKTTFGDE